METCVRGFSYMPQNDLEAVNMQYIETNELERTWKTSRRQRLKDQEQKIWEEFVKEQDIVTKAYKEDPYQFLHELPDNCLKELMETELQKMKKENAEETVIEQPAQDEGDQTEKPTPHSVTFVEEGDRPGNIDMFHIFDDDNDVVLSGADDEAIQTPSTVRERSSEDNVTQQPADNNTVFPVKSTENVTNLIESSIYCAKVRDLRIKLNQEIIDIMSSLGSQDVTSEEPSSVSRRCRRSAEFSARFNRNYMYQLQRQVHDIKRHETLSLPFAQHTQFQSQMLRVVSLHHNLLQAMQVFHKSFPQTSCLRESTSVLRALAALVRDVTDTCRAVPAPRDCGAADLYRDELPQTCDKLDEAVNEYKLRVADFLSLSEIATPDHTSSSPSTRCRVRSKSKKRHIALSKSGSKSCSTKDTDARLSMYSLDTLRINLHPHSSHKPRGSGADSKSRDKSVEKSPRNKSSVNPRRPLMRAPAARRARARDTDVHTLVEAVHTCPSSHHSGPASRAPSPRRAPRTPRNSQKTTPRSKLGSNSPKKPATTPKRPLSSIRSEATSCTNTKSTHIAPVTKIQCAIKQNDCEKDGHKEHQKTQKTGEHSKDYHPDEKDQEKDRKNKLKDKQHGHIGNPGKEEGYTGKECSSVNLAECESDFSSNVQKKDFEGDSEKNDRGRCKVQSMAPARCEVTRLLRQLCSGDPTGSRNEKTSGAKNAQLYCISSGSPPRQPSTPQLLRILEETIQKKVPKPMYSKPKNPDRYRLTFNIAEQTADRMFQYRTKFVQHMLTSAMYANSAVGKPWEMIGSVSEQIIDEVLAKFAKEVEIKDILEELYNCETN